MKRSRLFEITRWMILAGFGLAVAAVAVGAAKLIVPKRRPLEQRHLDALENSRKYGFDLHPFSARTVDGVGLQAILLSPTGAPGDAVKSRRMRQRLQTSASVPLLPWGETRGTVVMLHGRGGIKEDAFPVAERFVAAGLRCICYDARAHGKSGGEHTTYGAMETGDVRAIIDTAEKHFGDRLAPYVVFGISQGAAVSLQALPEESRLRSAVVVSPFASLDRMVLFSVRKFAGTWIPDVIPWTVMRTGGWWAGFDPFAIDPAEAAARTSIPVMVVHGRKDRVIPVEHGREVYRNLKRAGVIHRWREVPDGYHFNVLASGGDDLYQEMIEFWYRTVFSPPAGSE